jgi:hypothetical protein
MSTYLTLGTRDSLGFEVHFEDLASFFDIFLDNHYEQLAGSHHRELAA